MARMVSQSDMRHWFETLCAMSPLDRFFNLVPVNGGYVDRAKTSLSEPFKTLPGERIVEPIRIFVWKNRHTDEVRTQYVYTQKKIDDLKAWAAKYQHPVIAVARFKRFK